MGITIIITRVLQRIKLTKEQRTVQYRNISREKCTLSLELQAASGNLRSYILSHKLVYLYYVVSFFVILHDAIDQKYSDLRKFYLI